jgi:hypothetical protein
MFQQGVGHVGYAIARALTPECLERAIDYWKEFRVEVTF